MEVNHLGETSGKPQGKNFYMQNPALIGLNGKPLNEDKKKEIHQKNMINDSGVKTTDEYQKEFDDITEYNLKLKDVFNVPIKLNGNTLLIKLYKHYTIKKAGELFIPNRLVIPYQTEGGKVAHTDSPLQFTNRAVIYIISPFTSENFQKTFKVGDVVDLKFGINLMQQRTWLTPESYDNMEFDNWFIINENMVEKGIL